MPATSANKASAVKTAAAQRRDGDVRAHAERSAESAQRRSVSVDDVLRELQQACGTNLLPHSLEVIRAILTRCVEASEEPTPKEWASIHAAFHLTRVVDRACYSPPAGMPPDAARSAFDALVLAMNREIHSPSPVSVAWNPKTGKVKWDYGRRGRSFL